MLCAEWSLVKRLGREVTVTPLWCKCWHCENCRPRRAARLVHEAKAGKPNMFITLTSRRVPGGSPDRAAQRLAHAWRQVRAEYLRAHGKGSLAFLVVFEGTKQGWPHLHIVARCKWLDQKWLSKRMGELIGSPIVDVRRVRGVGQVAEYVAKYIGKNPRRFIGTKRYWRSQDYLLAPGDTDENDAGPWTTYDVVRFNWLSEVRHLVALGYSLAMGRHEAVLVQCEPP